MSRLRRVGESCLWLLVIGAAVVAVLHVAATLRLVVLPLLFAVLLATILEPVARRLRSRGLPTAAAALAAVALLLLALAGVGALLGPQFAAQAKDVDVQVSDVVDGLERWIEESPLPVSSEQLREGVDALGRQASEGAGRVAGPLLSGAMVALEVLAALALTVVVLFFLLKDGAAMWRWLVGLAPPRRRAAVDGMGRRAWDSLGGWVRGQTLVALFDAVVIGLALVVLGVPLALPLAVLIFFGAYVPVIGAVVTGLLAVLVALAAEGLGIALAVLAVTLVVQQLEGNVVQPVVVGRAVHVHPVAILLGVTAGGVLAGIVGAMVAAPLVAVAGAVLAFLREGAADGSQADAPAEVAGAHD